MRKETTVTRWFVGSVSLAALAVIVVVGNALPAMSSADVEAAVFFAFAALVASSLAYRLPRGGFGNIAFIPLLSGVAVAPSVGAVIGAGVAVLVGEYFLRREPIRVLFNASQLTIAVGLAVLVYRTSGGQALEHAGIDNLAPFVAAFATFFVSNAVLKKSRRSRPWCVTSP